MDTQGKWTMEESDLKDQKKLAEFAKLRRSKSVTPEEKMYMSAVDRKNGAQ